MKHTYSRGGASIFIVVFTTLMLTVITTSFIQVMTRHQRQASNADLSQSAYDSAMAGVEDAKRALVALKKCEGVNNSDCNPIRAAFGDSQNCEFLEGVLSPGVSFQGPNNEVTVGDASQNQAYTCVKVTMDTLSVSGELAANSGSKLVPLKGVRVFDKVKISWFMSSDAASGSVGEAPGPGTSLPVDTDWSKDMPSVLRTQLIQFTTGQKIDPGAFDGAGSRTLLLRPVQGLSTPSSIPTSITDTRGSVNIPVQISCVSGGNVSDGYACSATISVGSSEGLTRYLNLSAIYTATSYEVKLLDSANGEVPFDGVQPEVDSTGRASDFFRRVRAKVSIGADTTLPDAALQVTGNICKDFAVTNDATEYQKGECAP